MIFVACCLWALCLTSCVNTLEQIDRQQESINKLQHDLASVRTFQADAQSTIDTLRIEVQQLKGRIEESDYKKSRSTTELSERIRMLEEKIADLQQPPEPSATADQPALPIQDISPKPSSEQMMYEEAYGFFEKTEYRKARELFNKLLETHPDGNLADNALFWTGKCYFGEKKYEQAVTACEEVIKRYPDGNKVPDAYLLQALSFKELNDPLTARILLESLVEKYPDSNAARSAKAVLKDM